MYSQKQMLFFKEILFVKNPKYDFLTRYSIPARNLSGLEREMIFLNL
jgi:hypothetical protein